MSCAGESEANMATLITKQLKQHLMLDDSSVLAPPALILAPPGRGRKRCGYAPRVTPEYSQTLTIPRSPEASDSSGTGTVFQPLLTLSSIKREVLNTCPGIDGNSQSGCHDHRRII